MTLFGAYIFFLSLIWGQKWLLVLALACSLFNWLTEERK
jgi:hypothetical protein